MAEKGKPLKSRAERIESLRKAMQPIYDYAEAVRECEPIRAARIKKRCDDLLEAEKVRP